MSDNEIERLKVTLELDYQQYLRDVDKAVQEAVRKLKEQEESPKKQRTAWEQLGGYLKGQFLTILTGVGAAIAAAFSIQAVTNFFGTIAKGMIDVNKQFENFETQLTTLLGSQSEAKKRIDELSQFAISTPFELDKVVEASRLLQTFGGSDLAVGENLERIGNSAAGVSASFEEVSFWTGRLYSSLQAGKPFGEAAMRLSELGILTPEVRQKMEDMQKAGADGMEIWKTYSDLLDNRFAGAMDRMSKTLTGTISNLNDFKDMLLRRGGEDLFEGAKEDAQEFYSIIADPKAQEALVELSKAFGSILDSLREAATSTLLEQLKDIDPKQIDSLASSVRDIGEEIGGLAGIRVTNLNELVETLDGLAQEIASLIQLLDVLKQATGAVTGVTAISDGLDRLGKVGAETKDSLLGVLNPLYGVTDAFGNLNRHLEKTTGLSVSEWLGGVKKELDDVATAGENAFDKLQAGAKPPPSAPTEPEVDFGPARERFEKLSQDFMDAQKELAEKSAEAEKEHGERVTEIQKDYEERIADLEEDTARRREEIVKDSAEALADLEKEGARRREEIAEDTAKALAKLEQDTAEARADAIESAQEDLAALEEDTQNSVAEVQEEARDKERRETEDHQREMQRLQQNYLLNLEDAVKNRDARAIVDLRRKYQQEKREREEDFQTNQARSREDTQKRIEEAREAEEKRRREIEEALEKQLEDIEENEAKKREEIEASQQEQLADLAENEEEKRTEIAANQEEALAKLQENEAAKRAEIEESLQEQLAKEQENYQERQAALQEALQKRLEAIAQQLADEKDITEAGAEAILETLNSYYGVGGKIDQLMEDYRSRQAAQAAASSNFDANLPGGGPGGGDFTPPGSGGGAGLPAFAEGGIVPGPKGRPRIILAHAGELIIPHDQTDQWMQRQGDMMAQNLNGGGGEMTLNLKISGSAPPGVGGQEVEAMAGMLVKALNEAGIRTNRK